jgi:hypothetical protein
MLFQVAFDRSKINTSLINMLFKFILEQIIKYKYVYVFMQTPFQINLQAYLVGLSNAASCIYHNLPHPWKVPNGIHKTYCLNIIERG